MASNEFWLFSVDGFFSVNHCSTSSFLVYSSWHACTSWTTKQEHIKRHGHTHINVDTWTLHLYWFMALGKKRIDKYLKCSPIEMVKLNWAELRQMRCCKLNKRSSLLGDSTMVIRVSCELPYIIYGCAVGCLQLNRPTVHWLGILLQADS